jgi:hypothetical protein
MASACMVLVPDTLPDVAFRPLGLVSVALAYAVWVILVPGGGVPLRPQCGCLGLVAPAAGFANSFQPGRRGKGPAVGAR